GPPARVLWSRETRHASHGLQEEFRLPPRQTAPRRAVAGLGAGVNEGRQRCKEADRTEARQLTARQVATNAQQHRTGARRVRTQREPNAHAGEPTSVGTPQLFLA